MTVTEFCGDPIFEAAARHWPEREHGWQGRLSDLLDAVRDSLEAKISTEGGLRELSDAVYDIENASYILRRFLNDRREACKKAAA